MSILQIFGIDEEKYIQEIVAMAKVSAMRGDSFSSNDISSIVFAKHLDKQLQSWYDTYMSGRLS